MILFFVQEWYEESNKNICVIAYGTEMDSGSNIVSALKAQRMVETHRLEFVAKVARDFVIGIGLALSQVYFVGFCFGGHIATFACRLCAEKKNDGTKIGKLLLVDLAGISAMIDVTTRYPQKSDASYVQSIHIDHEGWLKAGTKHECGHVSIFFYGIQSRYRHIAAVHIHMLTATKKLFLFAESADCTNCRGRVLFLYDENLALPRPSEVLVGMDGELDLTKQGRYKLIVDGKFQNAIYKEVSIFSED